jgi:CubicO group peptidase (beta-lactamase class C family)
MLPFTPATPSTLYYTGSTTKSFTAAAILKLIEDSENSTNPIKLTTPISQVIQFVLQDDYATSHVTFEDMLCHRTGMPRHDFSYGGPNFTVADMVRNLRNLPLTAEIRQRFQYCNMMFVALSHAIQTVTQSWLGDIFREWLWEPLGMRWTFLSLEDAQKAAEQYPGVTVAKGYFWNNYTEEYEPEEYITDEILSGAGGTISSVMDYSLYLRAMITKDTRFLSERSFGELRTPRIIDPVPGGPKNPTNPFIFSAYGLGWQFGYFRNSIIYHHGGSVPGFGAFMAYTPEKECGIAIMANTGLTSNLVGAILATELLDRVFDVPADKRQDVASALDGLLRKKLSSLKNATRELYPNAPTKSKDKILHSLPLSDYAGNYWNPGYGSMTLQLANTSDIHNPFSLIKSEQVLHVDVVNKTSKHEMEIEHVNAEHFIAWMHPQYKSDNEDALFLDANKAEFRVGADGRAEEVGLRYEAEMGEDKIWYRRTE